MSYWSSIWNMVGHMLPVVAQEQIDADVVNPCTGFNSAEESEIIFRKHMQQRKKYSCAQARVQSNRISSLAQESGDDVEIENELEMEAAEGDDDESTDPTDEDGDEN